METLDKIIDLDVTGLRKYIAGFPMAKVQGLQTLMCGKTAVYCTMEAALASGAKKAELITYANSGDAPPPYGDKGRVVGYGAVVIYKEK